MQFWQERGVTLDRRSINDYQDIFKSHCSWNWSLEQWKQKYCSVTFTPKGDLRVLHTCNYPKAQCQVMSHASTCVWTTVAMIDFTWERAPKSYDILMLLCMQGERLQHYCDVTKLLLIVLANEVSWCHHIVRRLIGDKQTLKSQEA